MLHTIKLIFDELNQANKQYLHSTYDTLLLRRKNKLR